MYGPTGKGEKNEISNFGVVLVNFGLVLVIPGVMIVSIAWQ